MRTNLSYASNGCMQLMQNAAALAPPTGGSGRGQRNATLILIQKNQHFILILQVIPDYWITLYDRRGVALELVHLPSLDTGSTFLTI